MKVQSRLPHVGTSIFTIMSKMALDHGAINLSQGFPDFSIDQKIIALVNKYMLEGNNQYAPMPGVPLLRQVIADVINRTYKFQADPDQNITVMAGATEGIFATIAALINAGDEVIIFDPSYDSYEPSVRLNGGIPIQINLQFPSFNIDWDLVRKKISSRTRMIIINNPHNPSGTVLSADDLRTLEDIVLANDLIVLSDEVYERLIFDGLQHESILTRPALAANGVAVFSFGKTFHATGWKCGYTVAPKILNEEIRKTHQFITFAVNTPVQMAIAEYMKEPSHYETLGKFYQAKRDFFLGQLKGSGFEPLKSNGSYFQVVSYKSISNKSDFTLAEEMTKVHKVAAIPFSVFYKDKTDNHLLRFCFAKRNETLEKAGEILRKIK
jgi:methionine aminotransferase